MSDVGLADLIVKYALDADSAAFGSLLAPAMFSDANDWTRYSEGHARHAEAIREAAIADDWNTVLDGLGHFGRGYALTLAWRRLDPERLRRVLAEYWNLTEAVRPVDAIEMFKRAGFVKDGGRMPSGELTIYRGVPIARRRLGMSWTLDKRTAVKFACRRAETGCLYRAKVLSGDVLGYFASRREREVIVDPATLYDVQRIGSPTRRERGPE